MQAPETAPGDPTPITIATDIYAVGKLVWSAVTNKTAFDREKPGLSGPQSLRKVLSNCSNAWHLQHVLERTVRRDPADRSDLQDILVVARRVRELMVRGFAPLEDITGDPEAIGIKHCQTCGVGTLNALDGQPVAFNIIGKPPNRDYGVFLCTYCGYVAVINLNVGRAQFTQRKTLE